MPGFSSPFCAPASPLRLCVFSALQCPGSAAGAADAGGGGANADAEGETTGATFFFASSARFSSSTLTRGSPRKPSVEPSVWSRTTARTLVLGDAAGLGDAGDLDLGRGDRDVGVERRCRSW